MILSRSLKMETMLTLREIADTLCGNLMAAGFKPPPRHQELFGDCPVPDPRRETPGLNDRT